MVNWFMAVFARPIDLGMEFQDGKVCLVDLGINPP
jgi:hypothetical protein